MSQLYVPFSQQRIELYQSLGYWQGENHFDFLTEICRTYGDKIALAEGESFLTYKELYQATINFGEFLKEIGIKKDSFIILQAPNSIDFLIALFGIYYAGARPIFSLYGHRSHEIYHITKSSNATVYLRIKDQTIDNSAEDIVCHMPNYPESLQIIRTFNRGEIISLPQFSVYSSLPRPTEATSIAFLQLSGGTTGIPKLIPRTHDEYLYSVRESAKISGLKKDSVQLVALPISHNFAMSSPGVLGALYVGAKIVIAENGSPDTCFELIQKHKVTQVSLVPSLVSLWVNSSKIKYYDLSTLEVIQVGGARLSPVLAEKFINFFPKVILQQVYGMAEGLVNYTRLDDNLETIIYSQGTPISAHDEIVIVDENLIPLPKGDIGEIITRGPYTINGYYNADTINKKSFTQDGFYRTGDLGYINEKGNIVVTGRCKELINRGGEKIIPSELETILLKHPLIKDISIVGIPDELLGEKIHGYIMTYNNKTVHLIEIREFLEKQGVDKNRMLDDIEIVDSFNYTLIGKVKK